MRKAKILKIEKQVCSLEQAKKLNQLGIIQGLSIFFWDDYEGKQQMMMNATPEDGYPADPENSCFSAFTVAELGVMLPKRLIAKWKHPDTTGLGGEWDSSCNCSLDYRFDIKKKLYVASYPLAASCAHPNEANARAGLLIKLLEGKLVTAKDVNENLKAG